MSNKNNQNNNPEIKNDQKSLSYLIISLSNSIAKTLLMIAICSVLITCAWNLALVPMFNNIPEIKTGNVFVIAFTLRLVTMILFYRIKVDILEKLSFYVKAAEIINANILIYGSIMAKYIEETKNKDLVESKTHDTMTDSTEKKETEVQK